MSDSEQVWIRFNMPKPGAPRGSEVEVELTPYIQGLLDHGIASLIAAPASADLDPADPAQPTDSGAVDALCAETSDTSTDGPADPPADPVADAPIGTSRRKAADAALRAAAAQDAPTATETPAEPGDDEQPPAGAN